MSLYNTHSHKLLKTQRRVGIVAAEAVRPLMMPYECRMCGTRYFEKGPCRCGRKKGHLVHCSDIMWGVPDSYELGIGYWIKP
jgi:predicted Zn-ribbon and HTH transcriptional regulator